MSCRTVAANCRKFFIAVSLICLSAAAFAAQTKKSEIADPAKFQKIETAANIPLCRESLEKCGERALIAADLAGFGGPDDIKFKTETFVFKNGVSVYLVSMTGFEDDSVSGERLRVAFLNARNGFRFVQIGRQFRCQRGKNAGRWTKELCP